jgi:hypothetical protein
VDSKNVTNYLHAYKTTGDFSGYSNNCGPVAATNLMLYWYYRDNNKYGRLYKNNNWDDVFRELCVFMKKEQYNLTYDSDFEKAIRSYFNLHALGCGSIPNQYRLPLVFRLLFFGFGSFDMDKLIRDIGENCPPVLLLQNHKVYGDHYVLALGYRTYFYKPNIIGPYLPGLITPWDVSSTYIRIVDGRTAIPNRYIHSSVGYDSGGEILMMSVYPY